MRMEYRVIKHLPFHSHTEPVLAEYGWLEIRWVYYDKDDDQTPQLTGMDRGVHGQSPELLLADFAVYQRALTATVLVITDDAERGIVLLREDPPLATPSPGDPAPPLSRHKDGCASQGAIGGQGLEFIPCDCGADPIAYEVCLGCGKRTSERDCGCPAGTGTRKA